jgi:tetratricopeptide (TPR) repeat protein
MEEAIAHPRWQMKLDYLRCVYLAIYSSDVKSAVAVADRYRWQDIDDQDFLTLWLHLKSDELNHVQLVPIAERIVSITESDSVRLQYSFLIGLQHCLLKDMDTGIPMLEAAINQYESVDSSERSSYGRHMLAKAYLHAGEFKRSSEYLEKALGLLEIEVASGKYTPAGMALLWSEIGACHADLHQFEACERAYNTSLSFEHSALNEVFLATALIRLGRHELARNILGKLDISGFSDGNHFDLSIAKCCLAIGTRSAEDIDCALQSIKDVRADDPYFQEIVKRLIVQLYELRETRTTAEAAESTLAKFNRYVKLQPAVYGLGFDINAMIKDYIERQERRRKTEEAAKRHQSIGGL